MNKVGSRHFTHNNHNGHVNYDNTPMKDMHGRGQHYYEMNQQQKNDQNQMNKRDNSNAATPENHPNPVPYSQYVSHGPYFAPENGEHAPMYVPVTMYSSPGSPYASFTYDKIEYIHFMFIFSISQDVNNFRCICHH